MNTRSSMSLKLTSIGLICGLTMLACAMPSSAHAYWVRYWGWRPAVVVAAPPPPPAYFYGQPHYARWIPGHYDWRGVWIRPHWA